MAVLLASLSSLRKRERERSFPFSIWDLNPIEIWKSTSKASKEVAVIFNETKITSNSLCWIAQLVQNLSENFSKLKITFLFFSSLPFVRPTMTTTNSRLKIAADTHLSSILKTILNVSPICWAYFIYTLLTMLHWYSDTKFQFVSHLITPLIETMAIKMLMAKQTHHYAYILLCDVFCLAAT